MSNTIVHDTSATGACCKRIELKLSGELIESIRFVGGCDGNHRGIESLVRGQDAREVAKRLRGTDCCGRGTSCPDQLAKAIDAALGK